MKKVSTIIGAVLLTGSTIQLALASQRGPRKTDSNHHTQYQQFRDTNAFYLTDIRRSRGDDFDYGNGSYNRFELLREGGAIAAPAGR